MGRIRSPEERRIPTGIEGLDRILHGGLLRGASYALVGGPGTGKTVLSAQLSFHHARLGERIAHISLLSEPLASLLENLASFDFFDHGLVNERISFLSAYSTLEPEGLQGLHELIRQLLHAQRPSLVILDNATILREFAPSDPEYRACLRKLIAQCSVAGATLLVLTDREQASSAPELSTVDGLLHLGRLSMGMRSVRVLEVLKTRGSPHVEGEHVFEIDARGVTVYPRLEATLQASEPTSTKGERAHFGIEGLDEMIPDGLARGSTTGAFGPTGVGKTLLALSFVAEGLREGERAVYVSFQESPGRLVAAGEGVGLSLGRAVQEERLHLEWWPTGELLLDRLAHELFALVRERSPRRLVLDGLECLRMAAARPERVPSFLAALSHQLRSASVTSLFTEEVELLGSRMVPEHALSPTFENLLLLRFAEVESALLRRIAVFKTRDGDHDPRFRPYHIDSTGLVLTEDEHLLPDGGGTPAGQPPEAAP